MNGWDEKSKVSRLKPKVNMKIASSFLHKIIFFKRWKQEVETQTSLKIKCLKSDNGGEYEIVNSRSFVQRTGS